MKLSSYLLAACVTLAAALPLSAFEGKVHFNMKSGKDTTPIVYAIKGDKARIEMPNMPAGATVIDGEKQEMFVLMPEQRMYMVMSLSDAAKAAPKQSGRTEVKFEDTGETETILGRETRKYRVVDRTGTTEIWAAEGMGTFMGQLGAGKAMQGAPQMPEWQRELMSKGFFPLRVVSLNKRGRETMRMEATKIEEQSLPDEQFEIPDGFQRFDMGNMLRGLIPGSK